MAQAVNHPDIELVRRTARALSEGDTATLVEAVAPDFMVCAPGAHPLAGEHKGRDVVLQTYRQLQEATGGTLRVEPQHIFTDGRGHVIGIHHVTAERGGKRLDVQCASLDAIVGGLPSSMEVFEEDIDAVDEFFGDTSAAGRDAGRAEHPHAELVARMWRAMGAGDAALAELFTTDCVLHIAGGHRLAGEHRGRDAVLAVYQQIRDDTGGTAQWKPQQMFVDDRGHVVGVRHVTGERDGRRLNVSGALLYTVVGDRIAGVDLFEEYLDGERIVGLPDEAPRAGA